MNPLPDNLLNAPLAEGVRRVGFRKWYERELLSGHAHMALAVLAVIAMLGAFEAMHGATPGELALDIVFAAGSALIGLWALRRYLYLLMRAEALANQASCPNCGTYGRFSVVRHDPRETQVRCVKCAHDWTLRQEPGED